MDEWKEELEWERREKDRFFVLNQQSPIPPEERSKFKGLSYYPPDPNFRFELELHEHGDKKIIEIEDTKGNVRQFLRWGEFRFAIGNENCALQAYKGDPEEEGLFLPFRDATNGKETYGAGRYLDLDLRDRTEDGKWLLDFNRAYNPWCAYSEDYACPFVPPENWLKVPIEAGEKSYIKNKERGGIMGGKILEEDVRKILAGIKHPAIDRTLLDLGIIKSITTENNSVKVLLAFPFPDIPIKEQLIGSIRELLDKEGLRVEIETTVMNEKELSKFLAMEQEAWKGGM